MPSAATLDFEALLKPFEAPTASGKDLRADSSPTSLYQLLKEDRKTARQLETRISKGRHRGAVAGLASGGGEGDEDPRSTSPRTWRSAPT